MKVLIAEDDPHTRAGLEEILEAEGYRSVRRKGWKGRLAVVRQRNRRTLSASTS